MPFRNLLGRKSKSKPSDTNDTDPYGQSSEKNVHAISGNDTSDLAPPVPIVQIMRSTTHSQELLTIPSFSPATTMPVEPKEKQHKIHDPTPGEEPNGPKRTNTQKSSKAAGKRLSSMLHISRRSRAGSSAADGSNIPRSLIDGDVPPFPARGDATSGEKAASSNTEEERQAQWEKRAALLVQSGNSESVPVPPSPGPVIGQERTSFDFSSGPGHANQQEDSGWPLRTPSTATAKKSIEEKSDDDIQRAIQLHESGNLETSTSMFGRLADPAGANNALAQVLYGLALRHGWGITPDANLAVQYLTHSARNASQLTSSLGLNSNTNSTTKSSSLTGSGALPLAIYELGNSHRNGWGVPKSPGLAMQYFETAAELGDADAMLEVANGYEKGVKGWRGGKKDKAMAARWYRRAEGAGRKEVGNSWIWKEKHNDPTTVNGNGSGT